MGEAISSEVLVVGSGLAGVTAALRAQQLGLRTIILDCSDTVPGWSNSALSGGRVHAAHGNPLDDIETIVKRSLTLTDGATSETLIRTWANASAGAIDWLKATGATLEARFEYGGERLVFCPPKPFDPGYSTDSAIGDFLRGAVEQFIRLGGVARSRTRARRLKTWNGQVTGVVAESEGQSLEFDAARVILADGGFQANPDLLEVHLGTRDVVLRGGDGARGDALLMGCEVGGKATGTDRFYGHLMHRQAMGDQRLIPYPAFDTLSETGLVFSPVGRIGLGVHEGVDMANCIARSDAPLGAWLICSGEEWRKVYPAVGALADDLGAQVETADDLASLLSLMRRLDPEIAPHMEQEPGIADLVAGLGDMVIVPLCIGVTQMMGGLLIDTQARVVDAEGRPIPGLYAAGGSIGGLQGGPHAGFLGGLLPAVVFGLIAAEDAATSLRLRA